MESNNKETMMNTFGEERTLPPTDHENGGRAAVSAAQRGSDFGREVTELMALYPELREKLGRGEELPREVMVACAQSGISLRTAYAEYEAKRAKAEAQQLRKAIKILRQNASAAAKAPVKGAAAGISDNKGKDPFLEGLLSDD